MIVLSPTNSGQRRLGSYRNFGCSFQGWDNFDRGLLRLRNLLCAGVHRFGNIEIEAAWMKFSNRGHQQAIFKSFNTEHYLSTCRDSLLMFRQPRFKSCKPGASNAHFIHQALQISTAILPRSTHTESVLRVLHDMQTANYATHASGIKSHYLSRGCLAIREALHQRCCLSFETSIDRATSPAMELWESSPEFGRGWVSRTYR